jgi:putative aldouronate transport system permease protein
LGSLTSRDWLKRIKKDRLIYFFVIPGILFYFVFSYLPLYGIVIAFKDFRISRGISGSSWAGLKYFEQLFSTPDFFKVLANTVIISLYKIVFSFPVPIILAILLNEIGNKRFRSVAQSLMYLPYLISWVILGGIIYNMLSMDGILNGFREMLGMQPILYLGEKQYFRFLLVITDIWKNSGWFAIIYLAALTKINSELYEAATVDGASWLRKIWHITLPGIKDVMIVLFIISMGHLLSAGFEQVFVLYNQRVYETGDILDTFIFRYGILQGRFSFAAAAGLFMSLVSAILLLVADRISKRSGERGLI